MQMYICVYIYIYIVYIEPHVLVCFFAARKSMHMQQDTPMPVYPHMKAYGCFGFLEGCGALIQSFTGMRLAIAGFTHPQTSHSVMGKLARKTGDDEVLAACA